MNKAPPPGDEKAKEGVTVTDKVLLCLMLAALPWGQLNLCLRQEVSARRGKPMVKRVDCTSQHE